MMTNLIERPEKRINNETRILHSSVKYVMSYGGELEMSVAPGLRFCQAKKKRKKERHVGRCD